MSKVVKIIPKVCECGQRLGYRQKEYEDELISKQNKVMEETGQLTGDDMRLIELETVNKFFGMKMCCRNCFWNSRIPFIKDANKNAFLDLVGISSAEGRNTRKTISRPGLIFKPRIEPPEFPGSVKYSNESDKTYPDKDLLDSF